MIFNVKRQEQIQRFAVTAAQMTQIEARVFAAGMPVAALMEKVAGLVAQRVQELYPAPQKVGFLVGAGHNGADAWVVARELYLNGYEVLVYCPLPHLKELTANHAQYGISLGILQVERVNLLDDCDVLIDGLFGFGLNRQVEGILAEAIAHLNSLSCPILSIDLPSGIHTDTGVVLGTAIQATHTFCLGLWKRAFLQDAALAYMGQVELIDFGLPLSDIFAVLGESPELQRITSKGAIASLPLHRPPTTHKYEQGHLLLVCGSRQYLGAAILASSAARASGVGMLSIAVPESLRLLLVGHIPDALVVGCEEGAAGEIARLPEDLDLERHDAIACGCGLSPQAQFVVQQVLASHRPLILDADGLNILASLGTSLAERQAPTVLTPHPGEFKRLFPSLLEGDRILAVQQAARRSGAIVLLKGARTAIANSSGSVWVIPESTPALARGGSGDVLTGVMGGLLAQGTRQGTVVETIVTGATWWHSQAGIAASQARTELGVDASTLVEFLIPTLKVLMSKAS
ncbi:MAG: NAD(P)H-hydrate dehydratase [Timaviella obliquedivisa GSE-PSE-MK23-08B]|jgi:NAD(P)H-hydrate epimerase|nr:NAD(P)H-hydrate dehydratase [Timaviella obliquedivisa GSE-PSE-MK23-08B]